MTIILNLSPCPFCGDNRPVIGEAVANIFGKPQWEAQCSFCTAAGPAAANKAQAAQLWNRRVLPEKES